MASDKLQRAIAVAMDVSDRRDRGEVITDQNVFDRYPELRPLIDLELNKLRIRESSTEDAESGKADDGDIRFTVMVEDLDVEQTCLVTKPQTEEAGWRKPITETKRFRPLWRPAIALLRIYHDDQQSFESQLLRGQRTVIGRTSGDIIVGHDPLISSKHAEIVRIDEENPCQWRLRDLGSTNGTFVNVEKAKLRDGDELLLGSQRYRITIRGTKATLHHVVEGRIADSLDLDPQGTLIGREKCDSLESLWDEFLDPKHAFIRMDQQRAWRITNTKSVNGVWYRVADLKLFRSCFFQLGEQRFGFMG
jgi:Fe2+ transport system protein FeoA